MSHPKEYVTTGALMQCSEGAAPMLFKATPRTTKIGGFKAGNELDCIPILNIPSFVICKKTNSDGKWCANAMYACAYCMERYL